MNRWTLTKSTFLLSKLEFELYMTKLFRVWRRTIIAIQMSWRCQRGLVNSGQTSACRRWQSRVPQYWTGTNTRMAWSALLGWTNRAGGSCRRAAMVHGGCDADNICSAGRRKLLLLVLLTVMNKVVINHIAVPVYIAVVVVFRFIVVIVVQKKQRQRPQLIQFVKINTWTTNIKTLLYWTCS